MSIQNEIKQCIFKIQSAFNANTFEPFIKYIRFPNFKNIEIDERIDFDFPFTVLTGLNGSGKSSALHALYGAPFGKSTSDFWFNTNVDPILDDSGNPNCFIYGYNNPSLVEILKQRTGTAKGSDYWEPQAPAKKYNMIGAGRSKRSAPIRKNVRYIDFREQLSAFDKYFYFGKFYSTITLKTKQDVLRKYSQYLRNNIENSGRKSFSKRKVNKQIKLNANELAAVCFILGKNYSECNLLFHNFYDVDGVTIYFVTNNLRYSEAYAGRGEFAVVKLVYEIMNAPNNSLIILDEPEVSLHPGAQERLKLFLLRQTLNKKLQVVVSTHSAKLVEYLPDVSIKLFYENSNSRFAIKNKCNFIEAFHNIGLEITESEKALIIVEDITAELLISSMLRDLGAEFELLFTVKFFPGGAEQMYKNTVGYSEENELHKFVLLDGDKKKPKPNPDYFSVRENSDFNFIKIKLLESTGIDFSKLGFRIDGGQDGGDNAQKISSSIRYLKFIYTNLDYLPKGIPEELIWDKDFANNIIIAFNKKLPNFGSDLKLNINEFAAIQFGDTSSNSILSAKKQLIDNFIRKRGEDYEAIKKVILTYKELIETH